MNTPISTIGCILLAAGNSSRMTAQGGALKQLLNYEGHPLLRRAAHTIALAKLSPIVVVLGANAERIRLALASVPVSIVENPQWASGMGASLRVGLAHLLQLAPTLDAVVLTVCDQPLIDADDLHALIVMHHHTRKPLIAAAYENTVGVPALVARAYFEKLAALPDGTGAKSLFTRHPQDLATVPLPHAALDIDDPAAYQQLLDDKAT